MGKEFLCDRDEYTLHAMPGLANKCQKTQERAHQLSERVSSSLGDLRILVGLDA